MLNDEVTVAACAEPPMELSTWLIYLSVISLLIFSPGPSALLCLSDGLKFGRQKSIATVIGGATAAMLLMTVSAIGLGAVLVASEALFFAVKLLGAAYLLHLGWSTWKDDTLILPAAAGRTSGSNQKSAQALFKKGFIVGISNLKDLLFFIALFPSFVSADLPQVEQYTVLAATWFTVDCTVMYLYVALGSKISPWLASPPNLSRVNRTVGAVFIALGSALAISTLSSQNYKLYAARSPSNRAIHP